jgi:hypothetical protein
MKTKILYPLIIGLCLMLCGIKSSAQCTLTITVDPWTLNIIDDAGYTYTCSAYVMNSDRACYSDVHNYGVVYMGNPNSMVQWAYPYCHAYDGCSYWIHVKVTRSDNATREVNSTAQLPDISYHISPGTLSVKFN